ncbi:MAG: hydroxylase [Pseudomonadota bacterium]
MKIQYLEIVTTEVDKTCETYSLLHKVAFKESDPILGGARVAEISNGGLIGIRAPLRDTEQPTVRPYILVENIEMTVKTAEKSGAEVAVPPMKLGEHGTCAIVIHHGIETGFWQL